MSSGTYQVVSEHSILSAQRKIRDAALKFLEDESFNSVPEWKESLREVSNLWERRAKGERAKREGRRSRRDHAPCRKKVKRGEVAQKLHEIYLDHKWRMLSMLSRKPEEESETETEPETETSETGESEKEKGGIAGDDEPKWDSGDEESVPEESPATATKLDYDAIMTEMCRSHDSLKMMSSPVVEVHDRDDGKREGRCDVSDGEPPPEPPDEQVAMAELQRARELVVQHVRGLGLRFSLSAMTRYRDAWYKERDGKNVAAEWSSKESGLELRLKPLGQAHVYFFKPAQYDVRENAKGSGLISQRETKAKWSGGGMDLSSMSKGQAQLQVSKSDPFFVIKRGVSIVIAEKDKKLIGFGWFQKKVDFTSNPMGQAHNFLNTPPIFTTTRRTLQVVDELNNQRDQLFNIFPLFSKILREEREVDSGRFFYNGFELLFKGVKLIKLVVGVGGTHCSGVMQVKENSIMKFLFVLQWDPGGFTRDEWSPSGIKGDENLQESATTSAMKCHEVQTHQYHEVFLNFQQNINLVGNYGGASMSSKMLKNDVIKVNLFDNEERWLQSRVNKIILVFEYVSSSTLRNWILDCNTIKSLNWAQVIRTTSVSARKGFLLVRLVPNMYCHHLNIEKVLLHHFMEEQAWVIKIVVPATVYNAQTAPLLLWDPFFNNFLPLRQYTGLSFTVESFMAFLNFCIEESATSEASVQEYKKTIESQEWIHNCYCVQSESEIPQGDVDLINGWLKEYVSDSIRTVENKLIGVEHLVQGSESSRMPLEEGHRKQRDPGEHFSDFCSIGTLCFKLWDPGGRPSSLLFFRYLHLEDKVNFEGGSIDENLGYTNPRQTNRFGKVYSRRGKKGNSGLVMSIEGENGVTNSA